MRGIRVDRLSVEQKDGAFWAVDWVPDGPCTVTRYHLRFKNKRDAEAFVKAAKRAGQVPA
jgi:hypothetical protein